ncbi:MAG: phosphoribosylformylglycinamidine synthase subunit PurL, partial [Chitinophagaceae bacterium]|nr:phosphoribosylformylglycinamidine synthase subunit PurL [Chitinophagaceae bacterium]
TESSAEDLPAVQVGDPFQEKKLLEACLEIISADVLVGMQDMGAAGIICSTSETSAKGVSGMRINLEKVPVRQENMKPWELLLSESQERMLLVIHKGREEEVMNIFEKWDLPCSEIGEVTGDGMLRFYMDNKLEAELPAESLVLGGGAPVYEREIKKPAYLEKIQKFSLKNIRVPKDLKNLAEQIIALPAIASKRWITTQYDSTVGIANSNTNAPSDASIVLIKNTTKALVITTDCNSRYVFADPYIGCMIAVSEAARNIVCSGGVPLGVTNCLNFGNPYDPEVYYQFVEAIKGMGEACKKFETPVTGGNVSFYNQSPDGPVYPTPTIGMVGLLENIDDKMTLDFKNAGDVIYLVGESQDDIGSSEYLHKICGVEFSPAPHFELEQEFRVQGAVRELIKNKLILSAHDISEGGLFVTLCESAFNNNLGFNVAQVKNKIRKDAYWFGEAQSRVVVSVSPGSTEAFEKSVDTFEKLGTVTEKEIIIDKENWGNIMAWKDKYETSIEKQMKSYLPE